MLTNNRNKVFENVGKLLLNRQNISTINGKRLEVALRGNVGLNNAQRNELNAHTRKIVKEAIQLITVLSVYSHYARSRHGHMHEFADIYLLGLSGYLTMLVKQITFYGTNSQMVNHVTEHVRAVFNDNKRAHYKVSAGTVQTYTRLIVDAIKHNRSLTEDDFNNLHFYKFGNNYDPNHRRPNRNKTYMHLNTNTGKAMATSVVDSLVRNVKSQLGNNAAFYFKNGVMEDEDAIYVNAINGVLNNLGFESMGYFSYTQIINKILIRVRSVLLPNELPKDIMNELLNN